LPGSQGLSTTGGISLNLAAGVPGLTQFYEVLYLTPMRTLIITIMPPSVTQSSLPTVAGLGSTSAALVRSLTPTVSIANQTVAANSVLSLNSLLSASDPGGVITEYQFWDDTVGGGSFYVNGVQQAAQQDNPYISVTAAQLAAGAITFNTGVGTTDTLFVRVLDGAQYSSWTEFTVTSAPALPPTITATSTTVPANTVVSLATVVAASDPTASIVSYQFVDNSLNGGAIYINGVKQILQPNQYVTVTAAELSSGAVTLDTGVGTTDKLMVRASNGSGSSGWTEFQITSTTSTSSQITLSPDDSQDSDTSNASAAAAAERTAKPDDITAIDGAQTDAAEANAPAQTGAIQTGPIQAIAWQPLQPQDVITTIKNGSIAIKTTTEATSALPAMLWLFDENDGSFVSATGFEQPDSIHIPVGVKSIDGHHGSNTNLAGSFQPLYDGSDHPVIAVQSIAAEADSGLRAKLFNAFHSMKAKFWS
jgi:hypothetical protein